MPGGMNQAAMMKQAQKMQQEMLRMQAEQEAKTFTAKAGGGMVSATVNGKHELVSLEINPEAVDPEDVEMLQDMVIAAVNEALRAADALSGMRMRNFLLQPGQVKTNTRPGSYWVSSKRMASSHLGQRIRFIGWLL